MVTVEKLTLDNMGIAFGILSLGGTEPEIHLGVIYPPPQLQRTFKKYHCNTRVKHTRMTHHGDHYAKHGVIHKTRST